MRPSEDDSVLTAAQLGEPWALQALYGDLAPRVRAYLVSRGAAEPEDLTSEVFLALFPKLPAVTGGASGLRTLVFSIAHARLVDDFRARSRRPAMTTYEAADDPRAAASAEDHYVGTAEALRLLASLPDDQRDVVTMRVLGDLSVSEVATVLDKSEGAVKQLQRRGLLALKETLGDRVTL